MTNESIFCLRCKFLMNKTVCMTEMNGKVVCPECNNSYFIDGIPFLEAYEAQWKESTINAFYLLRPELNSCDLFDPELFSLYLDCYQTLLIGRYNASIVMMGLLVEKIAENVLYLKLGKYVKGPLGNRLNVIEENNLMDLNDIRFISNFKDRIRNRYQHLDYKKILEGIECPVWKFNYTDAEDMLSKIEKCKSGEIAPTLVDVSEMRALWAMYKEKYDSEIAITLFNEIYDFMLRCKLRYFNQHEWDEHHKKFKNLYT